MHGRVIVANMSEFEHSSSRAGCTFSMQDSSVKRGSTTGHKTQQARLPTDSRLCNSTIPSLVSCILTIPECRSDLHGSCTSTAWSRQSVCSLSSSRLMVFLRSSAPSHHLASVNSQIFQLLVAFDVLVLCSLLLLCSLMS